MLQKTIGIAVSPELPVKVSAILLAILCLKSIADSDSDTSKVSAIVSLAIAIIDVNSPVLRNIFELAKLMLIQ